MSKVLVIDDSNFQRKNICKMLNDLGYETVIAENGQAGLDTAAATSPDCIITDLLMPVMDGMDFLESFREKNTTTPVIVLTADIQGETRKKCVALGATAFICKPVRSEELAATLGKVIQSSVREDA